MFFAFIILSMSYTGVSIYSLRFRTHVIVEIIKVHTNASAHTYTGTHAR